MGTGDWTGDWVRRLIQGYMLYEGGSRVMKKILQLGMREW